MKKLQLENNNRNTFTANLQLAFGAPIFVLAALLFSHAAMAYSEQENIVKSVDGSSGSWCALYNDGNLECRYGNFPALSGFIIDFQFSKDLESYRSHPTVCALKNNRQLQCLLAKPSDKSRYQWETIFEETLNLKTLSYVLNHKLYVLDQKGKVHRFKMHQGVSTYEPVEALPMIELISYNDAGFCGLTTDGEVFCHDGRNEELHAIEFSSLSKIKRMVKVRGVVCGWGFQGYLQCMNSPHLSIDEPVLKIVSNQSLTSFLLESGQIAVHSRTELVKLEGYTALDFILYKDEAGCLIDSARKVHCWENRFRYLWTVEEVVNAREIYNYEDRACAVMDGGKTHCWWM